MNDNINTITHVLQKKFPNRAIQHQFANNLHTFRLHGETEPHWLYVARELVEQSNMKGVHEVDGTFTSQAGNACSILASSEPRVSRQAGSLASLI